MGPKSIRGRLTLWYVAALGLCLALVECILFADFRETLTRNADDRMHVAALRVARALAEGEQDRENDELTETLTSPELRSQEIAVAIFRRTGQPLTITSNPARLPFVPGVRTEDRSIVGEEEETAQRIFSLVNGSHQIEVAMPWDPIEDSLEHLALLLAVLFLAFMVIAGVGGWALIGASLRPIETITATANRIHADNLSERLHVRATDREIQGLATTLNTMVERLEDAFQSQKRFTADASHELRTPITIVQNEVEVALARFRSIEEYQVILRNVLEETRRMGQLIRDMLFLARTEATPVPMEECRVSLQELCRVVVNEFQPMADAKGLDLSITRPETDRIISGDPEALRRLFENLVDNALKYTSSPGRVTLRLASGEGLMTAIVEDTGPGIAPEHLPHIFERFYRVDKSRSRSSGGSGLGLSICRRIAQLHGGTLTVESAPHQGTRFLVSFPEIPPEKQ